jgi:hypothetical protein
MLARKTIFVLAAVLLIAVIAAAINAIAGGILYLTIHYFGFGSAVLI